MDLLTALEHELGHLLGRDHEAGGVMQETLTAGTRRTVAPTGTETILGNAFLLLAPDADADLNLPGHNGKRK